MDVRSIYLYLSRTFTVFPHSWITSINWASFATAFATAMASFNRLEGVIVEVKEGSEQDTAYTKCVHRHLEQIAREHGLTLRVLPPEAWGVKSDW